MVKSKTIDSFFRKKDQAFAVDASQLIVLTPVSVSQDEPEFSNPIPIAPVKNVDEQATELLILSTSLDPRNSFKSFNIENICLLATKFYPWLDIFFCMSQLVMMLIYHHFCRI